jgi:hypothetical protein
MWVGGGGAVVQRRATSGPVPAAASNQASKLVMHEFLDWGWRWPGLACPGLFDDKARQRAEGEEGSPAGQHLAAAC